MTRRNMLIAGAAAGLVVILWYVLLWGPRKADLSKAKERQATAQTQRNELAARVARLKASQKDEPLKRARVEALRTTIPDDANLAAFILDTNDAASKAGIDFISVAPSPPTAPPAPAVPAAPAAAANASVKTPAPGGGTPAAAAPLPVAAPLPAEIKIQLQITGGYYQVLDFLNRVGEMPRLVITDGLNVSSDDKAKLSVGVTARMFVRSVPPGFGGVPLPATTATAAPAAKGTSPAPGTPATPAASTPPPTATAAPAVPAKTTSGATS